MKDIGFVKPTTMKGIFSTKLTGTLEMRDTFGNANPKRAPGNKFPH
jgi:hypothetical protein